MDGNLLYNVSEKELSQIELNMFGKNYITDTTEKRIIRLETVNIRAFLIKTTLLIRIENPPEKLYEKAAEILPGQGGEAAGKRMQSAKCRMQN